MVKLTGILSSVRSAFDTVNPLSTGTNFSMYDFLESQVQALEQEIAGLRRELSDAQAALQGCARVGSQDFEMCAGV